MTIVYAIIIFCILIFIHETGHLISAKAVGIRVNEFAIGMGPRLFGFKKGETAYSARLVPIGGFCAMEGEDEDSDDPRAFNRKPMWAKALVLFSGSLMNILLAIVILSMIIFYLGQPMLTLKTVDESSPVAIDGLEAGDTITEINGTPVNEWADVPAILQNLVNNANGAVVNPNADDKYAEVSIANIAIAITVDRNGETQTINSFLYFDADENLKIGITPAQGHSFKYFFESFGLGAQATWDMVKMMYQFLGQLFTGQAGLDQLTGPVGVVKVVSESAKAGFISVLQIAALISLNLGIVNLLPFPALDGGRLLFLVIRKFAGKKVTDDVEGKFHLVGIMLLFALMIIITIQDVDRFILQ